MSAFPWVRLALVGVVKEEGRVHDVRLLNPQAPRGELLTAARDCEKFYGLVGLAFFNKEWTVFTKPFLVGADRAECLSGYGQKFLGEVAAKVNITWKEKAAESPVSGLVTFDGINPAVVHLDWQAPEWRIPEGSYAAGLLYFAREGDTWHLHSSPLSEDVAQVVKAKQGEFRRLVEAEAEARQIAAENWKPAPDYLTLSGGPKN